MRMSWSNASIVLTRIFNSGSFPYSSVSYWIAIDPLSQRLQIVRPRSSISFRLRNIFATVLGCYCYPPFASRLSYQFKLEDSSRTTERKSIIRCLGTSIVYEMSHTYNWLVGRVVQVKSFLAWLDLWLEPCDPAIFKSKSACNWRVYDKHR